MHILADVTSLLQYMDMDKFDDAQYRLRHCPECGKSNPWRHGCYPRQSDRENNSSDSLNPILIQRYYCPACGKTCSVLPECIPPRRWYLWEVQQAALLLLLSGKSLRAIARTLKPTRHTIARWWRRFKEQFLLQESILRSHCAELGRTSGIVDFWTACFEKFSLAAAMRLCHVSGIAIP